MSIPIPRTKLIVPSPRPDLLSRQRVLEHFDNLLNRKLILLTAPAGYGKTTLLIDLAHRVDIPVCWYAMDTLDTDLRRFITGFIAAIASRFERFGEDSAAVLQGVRGEPDPSHLAAVVVNDIYEHIDRPFLMALDDFHFVQSSTGVNCFVSQFIQQVDDNCQLILSSRVPPALPDMTLLVARSQVDGFDNEVLAFQAKEIQDLILQSYNRNLSLEEARSLAEKTEGWITGLLLSTLAGRYGLGQQQRATRVAGVKLDDYLAQQVLDQQPALLRSFLLRSSLLEEFDAQLCATVLEAVDFCPDQPWWQLIDDALQRHLFIQPIGDEGWVRYHHLFQEFLQKRMWREHEAETEAILYRLADVYIAGEEWERAHQIYERLEDTAALADLIAEAGFPLTISSRQATLAQWIDALPAELVSSRPALLSLRGGAAVDLGEAEYGLALLERAAAASRAADDSCLAETLVRRAAAHRLLGDYETSLTDAEEALALTNGSSEYPLHVRARALRALGLAQRALGQLAEGTSSLEDAAALYEKVGSKFLMATVYADLAEAYAASGAYEEARRIHDRALAFWEEAGVLNGKSRGLNNLGVYYHFTGDYEQALAHIEQANSLAQRSGFRRLETATLAGIGDLYADLDAPEAALTAYRQARQTATSMADRFLHYYLNVAEASVMRRQGNLRRARQLLRSAVADAGYESTLYRVEIGRLALAMGRAGEAVRHLQRVAQQLDEEGQVIEAACAYLLLAASHHLAGQEEAARIALEQTFALAAKLDKGAHLLVVTGREARAFLKSTKDERARSLLRRVDKFVASIPVLRRNLRREATVVPFAPPRLDIQAFGGIQVKYVGQLITRSDWESMRAPELLFLLLAYPEGLTKEEIGVHLWPESAPESVRENFKKTIARLRGALDSNVVVYEKANRRYYFNREVDYRYDVARFRAKLRQARGSADSATQMAAYEAAVALYQGHYLPEVVDSEWADPERRELERAYENAVLALTTLCLEQERYRTALRYCRRLLATDPYVEEAHRLAMQAYAARDDQAGVARQFEQCRQALEEGLGVEPSEQTIELYHLLIENP